MKLLSDGRYGRPIGSFALWDGGGGMREGDCLLSADRGFVWKSKM